MPTKPDDTTDELPTINPEEMRNITLSANRDVSELPPPVRNYLAERAREIEEAFRKAVPVPVGHSETTDDRLPFRIKFVGPEEVADVSGLPAPARRRAYSIAHELERGFIQEVEKQYETFKE